MVEWVRESTGDRTVHGSSPTSLKSVLFGTLAIPFTPLCQCLSDETVKAVGPFYLVSMLPLYLSAAFDTIVQSTLLERLHGHFGNFGIVFSR